MASASKRIVLTRRFGAVSGALVVLLAITAGPITTLVDGRIGPFRSYPAEDRVRAEVIDAHTVILNDIRGAGESPDGIAAILGAFPEVTTETPMDRVRFIADVDSDGDSELVTYEVSRGYLLRTVQDRRPNGWSAEIPVAVLANVHGFTVRFLDEGRNPLAAEMLRSRPPHSVELTLGGHGSDGEADVEASFRGETPLRPPAGLSAPLSRLATRRAIAPRV